jgi:hypothetical protein
MFILILIICCADGGVNLPKFYCTREEIEADLLAAGR